MTSKDEPDFMAVAGIGSLSELESLYAASGEASVAKESDRLTDAYAAFIKLSPLVILATGTGERIDTSPRGDEPGFVRIVSDKLLALPDRRGNNRIDSLRNIIVNPSLSLLFLIPGAGETVRVRGRGRITADENVRAAFAVNGKLPATVLLIDIDRVYFQCARALMRSRAWDPATHARRADVPTAGQMVRSAYAEFDAENYDAELPERQARTLY